MICRHICKNFSTSQQENSSEGIDEKGIDCLADLFERYHMETMSRNLLFCCWDIIFSVHIRKKVTVC